MSELTDRLTHYARIDGNAPGGGYCDVLMQAVERIAELEALVAAQNARLESYRRLYDMWGADDSTDAKFAEAYERIRMSDRV